MLSLIDKETIAKIYRNTIIGSGISDNGWDSSKEYYLKDFSTMLENLNKKGYDVIRLDKTEKIEKVENLDKKSKTIK